MAADWGDYMDRVEAELRKGRRQDITHTIERVQTESGTTMSIPSLREAGFWNAVRDARPDFDTAAKHGVDVEPHTDEAGKVVAVTYRLARQGGQGVAGQN